MEMPSILKAYFIIALSGMTKASKTELSEMLRALSGDSIAVMAKLPLYEPFAENKDAIEQFQETSQQSLEAVKLMIAAA
jgi:hypothetical protein